MTLRAHKVGVDRKRKAQLGTSGATGRGCVCARVWFKSAHIGARLFSGASGSLKQRERIKSGCKDAVETQHRMLYLPCAAREHCWPS